MEYKHVLSKSAKLTAWGPGEWVEEADAAIFESNGFDCRVIRNNALGNLLGYVKIPENHPWHGKGYDNIESEAHGGLTYSGDRFEDGDFWIGFDCGHSFDMIPSQQTLFKRIREKMEKEQPEITKHMKSLEEGDSVFARTYRTLAYVIEECKRLAKQAKEATK